MDESNDAKIVYTLGNNKIWFCNNCITGLKFYFMILAFISYSIPFIVILVIIFKTKESSLFIFHIVFFSLFYFLQIFSTIRAGCTDPGILPKQYVSYIKKKQERKSIIRGHLITLKYCLTCDIFRPPRSSHCTKCDNCVQKFDHHCDWVGNCIGIRNYKFFYLLLLSLIIDDIYQIGFCISILYNEIKNRKGDSNYILIIVLVCVIILYDILFLILFLGKLFFPHTYFCINNLTYYENYKKKFKKVPGFNPYKFSFFYNFTNIFCKFSRKTRFFDEIFNSFEHEKTNDIQINNIIQNIKSSNIININKKNIHNEIEQVNNNVFNKISKSENDELKN